MSPEKDLRRVSTERIAAAVRAHGSQKALAVDLGMSDTEVSRLINDQVPKLATLLALLGLEVVEAGHVADLRRVLKEIL